MWDQMDMITFNSLNIKSLRFYPEFSCKQLADHLFPGQGRCRCQGPETWSRALPAPLGPQLQVPHSGWHLKGAWWWIGWNNMDQSKTRDGFKKMFQHQRPEEVKTSLFSWSSNGENGLLSTSLLRCFFLARCAMATGCDTGATLPTSKTNTTVISINRWF